MGFQTGHIGGNLIENVNKYCTNMQCKGYKSYSRKHASLIADTFTHVVFSPSPITMALHHTLFAGAMPFHCAWNSSFPYNQQKSISSSVCTVVLYLWWHCMREWSIISRCTAKVKKQLQTLFISSALFRITHGKVPFSKLNCSAPRTS